MTAIVRVHGVDKMADLFEIQPGEPWDGKGLWKGGRLDGSRTATVSCPKCGKSASLSGHIISDDGAVSPSLVCPSLEGCDFHEYVRLVGWKE